MFVFASKNQIHLYSSTHTPNLADVFSLLMRMEHAGFETFYFGAAPGRPLSHIRIAAPGGNLAYGQTG